jgi:hypothetical protein
MANTRFERGPIRQQALLALPLLRPQITWAPGWNVKAVGPEWLATADRIGGLARHARIPQSHDCPGCDIYERLSTFLYPMRSLPDHLGKMDDA